MINRVGVVPLTAKYRRAMNRRIKMGMLKVITNKVDDVVVCTLPNGERVEIEMVSVSGSDIGVEGNVEEAMDVLQQHLTRNQSSRSHKQSSE